MLRENNLESNIGGGGTVVLENRIFRQGSKLREEDDGAVAFETTIKVDVGVTRDVDGELMIDCEVT